MFITTIQARMSSSRLPGKVLIPIYENYNAIDLMVKRLSLVKEVSKIVILTTPNEADKPIIDHCKKNNYEYVIGPEDDVMKRMLIAFEKLNLKDEHTIIDLTSDCPLVPYDLIIKMIGMYMLYKCNYLSNIVSRGFPDGFDVQIYKTKLLKSVYEHIKIENHKEHSGWNILNYSDYLYDKAKIINYSSEKYFCPEIGLTLDTKEDLELIKHIYNEFSRIDFTSDELMDYILVYNPDVLKINNQIVRKVPGCA